MHIFELLKLHFPEIRTEECKLHPAVSDGMIDPLVLSSEDKFEEWLSLQSRKNFSREYILSLIRLDEEDRWLFAGAYRSLGITDNSDKYARYPYRYQTEEIPELSSWPGRIIVKFTRPSRQSYLNAEKWIDRAFIEEIRPDGTCPQDELEAIDTEEASFREGQVLYRMHRSHERSDSLVRKKKEEAFLRKHGFLAWEVCGFNFAEAYGSLGEGFIECHHTVPVSRLSGTSKTRISDLCPVCSNCHRMLHRDGLHSPEELRRMLGRG
jgi:hypothetical protein